MSSFWREVGDRVFAHTFEPFGVNSYAIVGELGVVVVDSGNSVAQGQLLLDESRALAKKSCAGSVVGLVNTHAHYDHCFGNRPFRQAAVPIVAHARAQSHYDHHARAALDLDAHARRELGVPQWLWEGVSGLHLTVELPLPMLDEIAFLQDFGRTLAIQTLAPAHTSADLLIHVADADIWIVGDVVEQGADPSIEVDSDVSAWITVLEELAELATPSTIFLPGHGDPCSVESVHANIDFLRTHR